MGLACGALLAVVDFAHMIRRQGIITLEDLFEEMLLLEIHDEHDTKYVDLNMDERINERSKVRKIPVRLENARSSILIRDGVHTWLCAGAHPRDSAEVADALRI